MSVHYHCRGCTADVAKGVKYCEKCIKKGKSR